MAYLLGPVRQALPLLVGPASRRPHRDGPAGNITPYWNRRSLPLPDQRPPPGRAERYVPRRVHLQPVVGEVEAHGEDERRLTEAELRGVDVVARPGAAGGDWLL